MTLTSSRRSGTSQPGKDVGQDLLSAAGHLRAITVDLGDRPLPDLVRTGGAQGVKLWRDNEICLVGIGEALRIPLGPGWAGPANARLVAEILGSVRHAAGGVDKRAARPLAMGALPYDPAAPGTLAVPGVLVVNDRGGSWATVVTDVQSPIAPDDARRVAEDAVTALDQTGAKAALPDRFDLSASMPHEEWKSLVRRALDEIGSGRLAKVVLARRVDVVANRPFVVPDVLARLEALYPSCTVFHLDGFLGASPEALVRRNGPNVLSNPLAGTVARSGDQSVDAALLAGLMASVKDRREHQLVVDAISNCLRPLCSWLEAPEQPSVLGLRNVSHLSTLIRGSLAGSAAKGVAPPDQVHPTRDLELPTALELAALLQPTPAVGGYPTQAATNWQRANEGFERGRYAGPVGWVDSHGDGEWVLGLRCATVSGAHASLYAGNGIVAESEPEAELAETQLKLQALLAALVRP